MPIRVVLLGCCRRLTLEPAPVMVCVLIRKSPPFESDLKLD
jgi:hypothetical protein